MCGDSDVYLIRTAKVSKVAVVLRFFVSLGYLLLDNLGIIVKYVLYPGLFINKISYQNR